MTGTKRYSEDSSLPPVLSVYTALNTSIGKCVPQNELSSLFWVHRPSTAGAIFQGPSSPGGPSPNHDDGECSEICSYKFTQQTTYNKLAKPVMIRVPLCVLFML